MRATCWVIIDEAGGVPKSIFDAVDALATNIDARVVAVGNPDDPASHFATICKPGSGWHVETISAFDTPAYTGQRVPEDLLPLLDSPEWVEERKVRWGVTSPIYQSKVLGEFPDISDDSLILPKWIEAAQKRSLERTRRPITAADVARFGEDETVIMRREGGWIRVYRAQHKAGWPSSNYPSCRTTVARLRSTKSVSSMLERKTSGHCGSGSSRVRSISTLMTTSSPPSSARSSGASTHGDGSRSNRRTTCASVGCRHRIGPTRWPSPLLAELRITDECGESFRREHHWGSDDEGVVSQGPGSDTAA